MSQTKRRLRRTALLCFPNASMSESVVDEVLAGGFTDVGIGVGFEKIVADQGFSLEQAEQLAGMCEQRGLGLVVFTCYETYFPEHLVLDDPKRLMVTSDGEQLFKPYQELPDRVTFEEVGELGLCPFRPENKAFYKELLLAVCEWPATCEIHVNDEASLGWFGNWLMACYCDTCQAEFKEQTGSDPPVKRDWEDALWWAWLAHRFENWNAVHAEFRSAIKEVRPDIVVGQQHSPAIPERMYNAWVYGINLARQATTLDVICTDPYHYNHANEFFHRPHRRILTEGTRSLMGAAYDRQVNIYTQGFMPLTRAVPMGRQDGLLEAVVPFALGADMVVPYTYELMKIIPGFFEGFQEARKLIDVFESHRPYAYATTVMPHQSEVTGHYDSHWGSEHLLNVVNLMYQTGVPWRWFWDGRLEDAAGHLSGPLVLPEVHCLTEGQLEKVREVGGEGLVWIGNVPQAPWAGSGPCRLPAAIEYGSFEVALEDHPLTLGLTDPFVLCSRVDHSGPEGEVIGRVEGRPALVLVEEGGRREVWIAGTPIRDYSGSRVFRFNQPTCSIELFRRLVLWAGQVRPLAHMHPFPPANDYSTLRPSDRRTNPPVELLPMVGEGSLLAVIFPYTPVRCETGLAIHLPEGTVLRSVVDLWSGRDWTDRVEAGEEGGLRIPLEIPGDLELLALLIGYDKG